MSELTNSQCSDVNPGSRGTAGLLVDGSDGAVIDAMTELEWRIFNAPPGHPDDTLSETAEYRRLDCELALRGLPRAREACLAHRESEEAREIGLLYQLALERRTWLAATREGPQKRLVGDWRMVVARGGRGDAELIVPARVVLVEDDECSAIAERGEPLALEELLAFAERLSEFGLDVQATLGVSEREIKQAHTAAAQREEERETSHRMMLERKRIEERAKRTPSGGGRP